MNVGTAAAEVGLTVHTLRWYEQVGLLEPVERDSAGRRRYRDRDLDRLRFLVRLRSTGMPVRDMIHYIELVRCGRVTVDERVELLQRHRERVLSQVDQLLADLKAIENKIDNYRTADRSGGGGVGGGVGGGGRGVRGGGAVDGSRHIRIERSG